MDDFNPIDDAIIEVILDHAGYIGLENLEDKYNTILKMLWLDQYDAMCKEWFDARDGLDV